MFCLISICFCLIGLLLVLWFLGLYLTVCVCSFLILSLYFFCSFVHFLKLVCLPFWCLPVCFLKTGRKCGVGGCRRGILGRSWGRWIYFMRKIIFSKNTMIYLMKKSLAIITCPVLTYPPLNWILQIFRKEM